MDRAGDAVAKDELAVGTKRSTPIHDVTLTGFIPLFKAILVEELDKTIRRIRSSTTARLAFRLKHGVFTLRRVLYSKLHNRVLVVSGTNLTEFHRWRRRGRCHWSWSSWLSWLGWVDIALLSKSTGAANDKERPNLIASPVILRRERLFS